MGVLTFHYFTLHKIRLPSKTIPRITPPPIRRWKFISTLNVLSPLNWLPLSFPVCLSVPSFTFPFTSDYLRVLSLTWRNPKPRKSAIAHYMRIPFHLFCFLWYRIWWHFQRDHITIRRRTTTSSILTEALNYFFYSNLLLLHFKNNSVTHNLIQ